MLLALLALLSAPDTAVVRDVQVAPDEILRTTSIGSGEPVVFIPGIFGGAFGFRHVTSRLAEMGYRCVVVEPLAFGSSSHPSKADYSFAAQADRIGQVLDSLGVTSALIVAQSSGAAMAYRLAYRRPELLRGILSIEGGPAETPATPGLKHALRFGGFLTKLFVGPGTIRSRVRHDLIENSGDTTWVTSAVLDEYTVGQASDVHGTIDALRAMSKAQEPESLRDRLHEARIPIRLLVGSVDHPAGIKEDGLTQLHQSLVDFAVDSVAGSGQYVGEEQPQAVIDAVLRLAEASTPVVVVHPPNQ
ncbi:MAG TPA: alpha/beta hydrolase [Gemmatimonadales bacterium]|nr:alpha/beta hydrolase [Gemmatimonadales bacterium]